MHFSFQIGIHRWCSSAQFVSLCPLILVWWTLRRLCNGYGISWQSPIGAWHCQFDVILPLETKLKLHKQPYFGILVCIFLTKITQNLYKASNGTEKIICVSNFKNNVIDVWINKTKKIIQPPLYTCCRIFTCSLSHHRMGFQKTVALCHSI